MLKNSASWLIAIIISTKSCVTCEILPIGDTLISTFITKPIKNVYEVTKTVPAVIGRMNPLTYLVSPLSIFGINVGQRTQPQIHGSKPPDTLYLKNDKVPSNIVPYGQSGNNNFSNNKFSMYTFVTRGPLILPSKNERKLYSVILTTPKPSTMKNVEYLDITGSTAPVTTTSTYSVTSRNIVEETDEPNVENRFNEVTRAVGQLEPKFYQATFRKLVSVSPPERRENGITFAQSGLFLFLQLITLCTVMDTDISKQIKVSLGLETTCEEQIQLLKDVMSSLPTSSDFLKFRWTSRLVLGPRLNVKGTFLGNKTPELRIYLDHLNKTDNPEELSKLLNQMVEIDSGGAMHNTFEEDEFPNGMCAVWLTTMYLRARWRSAPTVLNGSRPFYDGDAPARNVRMIRINDMMRYAHLAEWDAEAIEIRYAVPNLTLLLLVPSGRSLNNLAKWISTENLERIYEKMNTKRVAVTLPIYTLRMTLLLPGKLETMGLSRLMREETDSNCNTIKLSHAVQRIMFWAEAGRNAFKDDGIEWDDAPEIERVVDHPYIFFVRWRNLTLLNGNFVL